MTKVRDNHKSKKIFNNKKKIINNNKRDKNKIKLIKNIKKEDLIKENIFFDVDNEIINKLFFFKNLLKILINKK